MNFAKSSLKNENNNRPWVKHKTEIALGSTQLSFLNLHWLSASVYVTEINFIGSYDSEPALLGFGSSNDNIFISNCSFSETYLGVRTLNQNITIFNSLFSQNQLDIQATAPLTLNGCSFQNSNGITITALTISDTTFNGMHGPNGAISSYEGSSTITIKNTHFFNCSSSNGGAINLQDSVMNILSSSFVQNMAVDNGGAIYLSSSSSMSVFDSSFINNTAASGGAFACDSTSQVQETNCTFTNNTPGGNCKQVIWNAFGKLIDFFQRKHWNEDF